MPTPSMQINPRLEDERAAFEVLEVAADIQKLIASAPDQIWLDLGENLEALTDDATFRDLSAVTWSEDNATGCGIKYVRAALNGADAGVSGGWQDIATAPKDGTAIILGLPPEEGEHDGFSGQGRWHQEDDDGPDNMGHDAGFMDDNFSFFRCARSIGNPAYQHKGLQPTAWQPLPSAPTQGGSHGK